KLRSWRPLASRCANPCERDARSRESGQPLANVRETHQAIRSRNSRETDRSANDVAPRHMSLLQSGSHQSSADPNEPDTRPHRRAMYSLKKQFARRRLWLRLSAVAAVEYCHPPETTRATLAE